MKTIISLTIIALILCSSVYCEVLLLEVSYSVKAFPGDDFAQTMMQQNQEIAKNIDNKETKDLLKAQAFNAAIVTLQGYEYVCSFKLILDIQNSDVVRFKGEGVLPLVDLDQKEVLAKPTLKWDMKYTQIFDGKDEYYYHDQIGTINKLPLRYNNINNINNLQSGLAWENLIISINKYDKVLEQVNPAQKEEVMGSYEVYNKNGIVNAKGKIMYNRSENLYRSYYGDINNPIALKEWVSTPNSQFKFNRYLYANERQEVQYNIIKVTKINEDASIFEIPKEAYIEEWK